MPLPIAILCTAAVLLHGASCHLFPQAITNSLTSIKHKRRAVGDSVVQCIFNKLDTAIDGNNSLLLSDCKSSAIDQIDASKESSAQTYRTFCNPECGNVVLDAYSKCGIFFANPPGTKELLIGICGTNNNGDVCYEIFDLGLDLVSSEVNCSKAYESSGTCTCRSTLLNGVAQQGCCINVYHDYISGRDSYNPNVLYRVCNVNRPENCNNSPLGMRSIPTSDSTDTYTYTGSSSQLFCASASITILSACIYFALLG